MPPPPFSRSHSTKRVLTGPLAGLVMADPSDTQIGVINKSTTKRIESLG